MVATPSFKVDIGPSWELMDALSSPCSLRSEGAPTTTMVIRVSDNNSRFDVARADDGNAEADPYMGAR